jgi:hypothetical protein
MRHNKRPFKSKSLTEILTNIENGYRKFLGVYSIWGKKHASKSDLDIIFSALLNEERPEQLLCYLWVFRLQAVPILHDKLFEWAQDADFEIQSAAINVLANIKDYQVRQFGIDLLQKRPESIHQDALRLFWNNYELGDEQLFEEIVSIPNDMDLKHGVCFDLLEIGSKWQQHKLANLMAWVYENTPCSRCRRKSIKLLLEWKQASTSLLEEACWDCDDEIRDLARQALGNFDVE